MRSLLRYVLVVFILSSATCKEEVADVTHTYTGRYLLSCDNPVPVANVPLLLEHVNQTGFGNTQLGVVAQATTDSNGYFTFTFQEETKQGHFTIAVQNIQNPNLSATVAMGGPTDASISNYVLYGYPKLVFRIHTVNPGALTSVDSVTFYIAGMDFDDLVVITAQNVLEEYIMEITTLFGNIIDWQVVSESPMFSQGTKVKYRVFKNGAEIANSTSPPFQLSPCDTLGVTVDFAEIIP